MRGQGEQGLPLPLNGRLVLAVGALPFLRVRPNFYF